jgi:hypothetical protein
MELPLLNLLVLLISRYEFAIRSCFEIRPDLKKGGFENYMRISFPDTLEPEKASSSSLNNLVLIRGLFAEALRVHIKWIHLGTKALTLMGHHMTHNPVLIPQKETVILLFSLLTTSANFFAF